MRLPLMMLTILATLAFAFAACGGDDDASDTGDGAPTDTEAPTDAPSDSDDDDGQPTDGDDDDTATDAPDFTEDFGAPAEGNGGTGTIVIGDQTYEYDVVVCSTSDGLTRLNGRGRTADGEPFVALVSVEFGFDASADIGIGTSTISDPGHTLWSAQPVLNYTFGQNGVATLRFETVFGNEETGLEGAVDGSVDVVCQL